MTKENCILVSIITVAYNSEKTIKKTIESVLNQNYTKIQYIIKDGKSADNTVKIAERYIDQFKEKGIEYLIISDTDNGIYDGMNTGIKYAKGEIVGLINSDDWYETDAVQKVVQCYQKEKFDLFYADTRIVKKDKTIIKHVRLRNYITTRDWSHPSTFIKRDIYNKFQYKCESIYDDFDLVLRIRKSNYKVVILNEVIANFGWGGVSNEKNFKKAMQRARQRFQIYLNNGYSRLYFFECYGHEFFKYLLS